MVAGCGGDPYPDKAAAARLLKTRRSPSPSSVAQTRCATARAVRPRLRSARDIMRKEAAQPTSATKVRQPGLSTTELWITTRPRTRTYSTPRSDLDKKTTACIARDGSSHGTGRHEPSPR